MALSDLFQAINIFNEGMQKYAVGNALTDAQEQVKQLQTSAAKDEEKIQGLRAISDTLTQQWAQLGVNPATIAQTANTIMPNIQSSADAFAEAEKRSSPYLKQVGTALQKQEQSALDKKLAAQGAMFDKKLAAAIRTKEGAGGGKPLPSTLVTKLTDLDTQNLYAESLLKSVQRNSDLVGPAARTPGAGLARDLFSGEKGQFDSELGLFLSSYVKAISGAAATDAEREFISKNIPKAGDRPAVFRSKMKELLRKQKTIMQRTVEYATLPREELLQRMSADKVNKKMISSDLFQKLRGASLSGAPAATSEDSLLDNDALINAIEE